MSKAGITVAIKGEINDLEAKITQSKEIINEATKQIIAENNKLKASQDSVSEAQKTYAKEIASAKDEIKKYIEIKSQNGKLTKEEQKNLAVAKAELALYKIKTNELIDVEKQRQQEIRKTINASKELSNLQRAYINDARLEIDTKKKIIAMENEVANSKDKTEKSTSNLANTTIRYLRWAGTIAGVVYAGKRAWDATVGSGIAVNKIIENNTYGIAALISANTQMVDSLGKTLSPLEKFTMGQAHAKKVIAELRTESTKTAATFPQLLEIFQQGIGKTLSMGDAFGATTEDIEKNTIKLASRMSNFANAIGMPMDRVKEEMRSLVSGNASTDSLIATIIFGSPGEANKAIKEAEGKVNGVAELLDRKFKPFDILADTKTFDKSVLAVQDAWSRAMGDMVEKSGAFKDITNIFYELSTDIIGNTDDIVKAFDSFYDISKSVVSSLDEIAIGVAAFTVLKAFPNPFTLWVAGATAAFGLFDLLNAEIIKMQHGGKTQAEFDAQMKAQEDKWTSLDETHARITKNIEERTKKQQSLQKAVGIYEGQGLDATKLKTELNKVTQELDDFNTALQSVDPYKKATEQVAKITADQKQAGQLIANRKIDTERMKEDEKDLLNLQGNIAKYKDDIAKKEKIRADVAIQLKKAEEAQAQAIKLNGTENIAIAADIATYKKDIQTQDKLIAENQRKINEENQKSSDEALRKAESLANKKKELNKEESANKAVMLEISMLQSGQVDEERLKISLSELKLKGMIEEKNNLIDGYAKNVLIRDILKEQLNLQKLKNDEELKQKKQYKFDQISGAIKYASMENLGQVYQELLVYYKEDPESLADLQTWVEKEQNKLSKKPLVIDIKLQGWDEVSNSIATFGNSFQDINKAQKKYQQENEKVIKDEVALGQARVDLRDTTISGIADMTGAVASFYDADDDRRKKQLELQKVFFAAKMAMQVADLFQTTAIEGTKQTLFGTTALANALTAPFPANIAAFATVAAMLASIGIMVGGKTKTTTTSDAFSSMVANEGAGSVLGDNKKASESIKNALGTLEDFAQPQYQTLQSMNKYLANISNSIGGVTSLLIQSGGFAFGEGAKTFDTGYKNNFDWGNSSKGGALLLQPINSIISKIPVIGQINQMLGSVMGSVMGGIFGKTSVSQALQDSGITFADQLLTSAINEFNGQAYQTISTTISKKSWFSKSSSTSISSYFNDLDAETERQFSLVLNNLYKTTILAGEALDTASKDTEKILSNFVVSIGKISLKDKTGAEIQETLTSVFGKIGDDIAKATFPLLSTFQKQGEGMFETLTRVSKGMEEAEYFISRLGKAFSDISYTDIINKQGNIGFEALLQSIVKVDEATYGFNNNLVQIIGSLNSTAEELYGTYTTLDTLRETLKFLKTDIQTLSFASIKGAGGIEALASGLSAYIENFLTENEQLSYSTVLIQKEFAKLNIAIPTSKEGFKNLLSSIDKTTESGQELYGNLIILSESFAKVSDDTLSYITTLEDSLKTQQDTYKKVIYGISAIGDSFLTTINSISTTIDTLLGNKTGTNKTNQNIQKYFDTKAKVESLLSKGSNLTTSEAKNLNSLTTELSGLATNIQSGYTDNAVATNELVSDLSDINSRLDFSNQILQVNIVDGLGDMLGMSQIQAEQLRNLLADTKLTNTELNSIAGLTQVQKDGIVEFANNSNYFSTEGTLSNLEEYSRLQLEALKQTQADESANLSAQTLQFGDYTGTQEKIDIAKLLGVSYESAKPLIQQAQSLSISKNPISDIQSILGYTAGSTSYDITKANQLTALSPYISGIDIGGVITGIQTNIEITKAQNAQQEALRKDFNNRYANATNNLNIQAAESQSAWTSVLAHIHDEDKSSFPNDNIASSTPSNPNQEYYKYGSYQDRWQNYVQQHSEAYNAYSYLQQLAQEKALKGYKLGGYTGNGPVDEISGYTHGKEYVVNAPDLQALGGPNELRSMIDKEKRNRKINNTNNSIETSNSKNDIINKLVNQTNMLQNGFNVMIAKLTDIVDFNEERKANNFPVQVSGKVIAVGA